ncbi:21067_t:CDS:1 [Gigaspora margarita]|uniref:21067_t:CDS:1 n=1 Tax=Gigaspora margarita TaxID=4874 RepID=A0ABN7UDX9_GIGMA|nr:21067_t:CDS:1 [Gigaspora margarita]
MNKNVSLYLSIALIAMTVISSIGSVISQRNYISNTRFFQTSEKIKGASRFENKYKISKGNKARSENKIYSRNQIVQPFFSVVNPKHNYPIGLFLYEDAEIEDFCTASVINTANGNIGLTAIHCLLDEDGDPHDLNFLSFSPGYDAGTNGPLGSISVVATAMPENPQTNDYALVRFEFDDPSGGNATLQDYTGALGWRFDIGDDEPTTVYGYPEDGDMEYCVRDGEHLCKWHGITEISGITHVISDMDLGEGASGGPFISQYETETNLGFAYAIYSGYNTKSNASFGDIWDEGIFLDLLLEITP